MKEKIIEILKSKIKIKSTVMTDYCDPHIKSDITGFEQAAQEISALLKGEGEYILCAAIWYKDIPVKRLIDCNTLPDNCDKGLVFCGARHCHCMHTMTSITGLNSTVPEVGKYVQGFLTNKNRFVNRREAYDIAFKANQIIGPNKGHATNSIGLTSEDLY